MQFQIIERACSEINKFYFLSIITCKKIVEAISKCGLRDSLQQVDIYYNHTLRMDEVQAMLNELEMPHISVVEVNSSPIE